MTIEYDEKAIADALNAMAKTIAASNNGKPIALVGIHSGGVPLAHRIAESMRAEGAKDIVVGGLDIGLYRDDTNLQARIPRLVGSEIPYDVSERKTILIDDVLFTGRTIRAALNQLNDYGRPASIELAVLVDRGHREVPISARYVGLTIETEKSQHVEVLLTEIDGLDRISVKTSTQAKG
ncbi:MAG: bifunctional pyr operon transcriptional regulator/uracil phosphoribosyltransferase PyrR [Planctomycetes bacterium]|nr:bifunctional pyr operon transcriptional regulator/uracil phosphoribosyltransferase PyrR [Planctomycetota bacterium]